MRDSPSYSFILIVAALLGATACHNLNFLASYVCVDGIIDAATRTEDGTSYLFRDDFYWKIIKEGVAYGYPRLISSDWFGVRGPIDAVVTWNDGSTFIFKGEKYWRFYNTEAEDGYPKLIREGFPGIPNNPDAAVVYEPNGKTYFFKGKYYWMFDQRLKTPVPVGYPLLISERWLGVPNDVEAALRWDGGKTYFFKHSGYYRYDEVENEVARGYPSLTTEDWFVCHNMTTDEIERERFGRSKPSQSSNSCSCSCSQTNDKLSTFESEDFKLEIQSIKDNILDVQKSVHALLHKPETEIVLKEGQPTDIIFDIEGSPDMFGIDRVLFPVSGNRREPLEEAPPTSDDPV